MHAGIISRVTVFRKIMFETRNESVKIENIICRVCRVIGVKTL